jgi:TPR repeat protein
MYEEGTGVHRDERRALEFYRKACAAGDDVGCKNADNLGTRLGR